jgi:type I restriction enzyme R subunit
VPPVCGPRENRLGLSPLPVRPEDRARETIDRQLAAAGWLVQDSKAMNLYTGPGVAVREYPLTWRSADYLLFVGRQAVGVIEAKKEG